MSAVAGSCRAEQLACARLRAQALAGSPAIEHSYGQVQYQLRSRRQGLGALFGRSIPERRGSFLARGSKSHVPLAQPGWGDTGPKE